jgi:rRNA processing protein Gar1
VIALGTFSHETRSGNLVIRGKEGMEKAPSIYSFARTKNMKVGKIQDVIGPKKRPYIVVKPQKKLSESELSTLAGETFYETGRKHARTRRNSN